MIKNICKFLPKFENYNFFNAINLVFETNSAPDTALSVCATFRMHIITSGDGSFVNERGEFPLKTGDILVTPPAVPFAIRNSNDLKYVYISYLGVRANILFDTYKTSPYGEVFRGFEKLIPLWTSALEKQRELANVFCEGVVLCSFAEIQSSPFVEAPSNENSTAAKRTKEFIDSNFTDKNLSLKAIGEALSYNPKYLSIVFKKEFKVNIVDYVRTLRIQHACTLMEQGLSYVKNIATMCGYENPLYFSSVFKEIMKISPTEHIKSLKNKM